MIGNELRNYVKKNLIGKDNGICELDNNGLVPVSRLNVNVVEYKGTWDALINSPTLANGAPSTATGNLYICSVAGTQFGEDYEVGDFIIYDGATWKRISGPLTSSFYTKSEIDTMVDGCVKSVGVGSNLAVSIVDPENPVVSMNTNITLTDITTTTGTITTTASNATDITNKSYVDARSYSKTELDTNNKIDMQRFRVDFYGSRSYPSLNLWTNQPTNSILGLSARQVYASNYITTTPPKMYDVSQYLNGITNGIITVYPWANPSTPTTVWCNIYRVTGIYAAPDGNGYIEYNVTPISINHTYTTSEQLIVSVLKLPTINASEVVTTGTGTIATSTNAQSNITEIDTAVSELQKYWWRSTLEFSSVMTIKYNSNENPTAINAFPNGSIDIQYATNSDWYLLTCLYPNNPAPLFRENLSSNTKFTKYFAIQLTGTSWTGTSIDSLMIGFLGVGAMNNQSWMTNADSMETLIYETTGNGRKGRMIRFIGTDTFVNSGDPSNNTLITAVTSVAPPSTWTTNDIVIARYNWTNSNIEVIVVDPANINSNKGFGFYVEPSTGTSSHNVLPSAPAIPVYKTFNRGAGYEVKILSHRRMDILGFDHGAVSFENIFY